MQNETFLTIQNTFNLCDYKNNVLLNITGDNLEVTLNGNYKKLSLINDEKGVFYLQFNEDMGNYVLNKLYLYRCFYPYLVHTRAFKKCVK